MGSLETSIQVPNLQRCLSLASSSRQFGSQQTGSNNSLLITSKTVTTSDVGVLDGLSIDEDPTSRSSCAPTVIDNAFLLSPNFSGAKSGCALDIGGTLAKLVFIVEGGRVSKNKPGAESGTKSSDLLESEITQEEKQTVSSAGLQFGGCQTMGDDIEKGLGSLPRKACGGSPRPDMWIEGNALAPINNAELPKLQRCHMAASQQSSLNIEVPPVGCTRDAPSVGWRSKDSPNGLAEPDFLELGKYRVEFRYFDTHHLEYLISFLKEGRLVPSNAPLYATGGGAVKFQDKLSSLLGVEVKKQDEMLCAMTGLSYLISNKSEVFKFDVISKQRIPVTLTEPLFPFILVNVGSGVSILKAEGPMVFKRISGTCIGGGTVLGLANLLFGSTSFDEVFQLAGKGTDCLDLTVADLFGDAAGSRCLPGGTLASSFGRLYADSESNYHKIQGRVRREDIAKSLITMVAYNLGYIAYLVGTIHNIQRVFFAGKFINNQPRTMEMITEGLTFYTKHYQHLKLSKSIGAAMGDAAVGDERGVHRQRRRRRGRSKRVKEGDIATRRGDKQGDALLHLLADRLSQKPRLASELQASAERVSEGGTTQDPPPHRHETTMQTSTASNRLTENVNDVLRNARRDIGEVLTATTSEAQWSPGIKRCPNAADSSPPPAFEALFLRHDGYLGALGALLLAFASEGSVDSS